MPIIICLKEPSINLILAGDIKDEASAEYDELFPNLMAKDQDGQNVVIPLSRENNIAFIKEVTQEDIDKQREEEKKRREQRGMGGGGSGIIRPNYLFPAGKGRGRS